MRTQIAQRLYKEYEEFYLNELYDSPLPFKKEDGTKYILYKKDGTELARFLFRFMYNVSDSPIDYRKYKIDKYWDISWYWSQTVAREERTRHNFIKVTSTSFKVVDDFIRSNNYPALLGFGGLSEKHENLYSNRLFVDRWQSLFSERYYVEWYNDKMWIVNKNFHRTDEDRFVKHAIYEERSVSEIYRSLKFPNKKDLTGIARQNFIKEQIKRVVLKRLYMK